MKMPWNRTRPPGRFPKRAAEAAFMVMSTQPPAAMVAMNTAMNSVRVRAAPVRARSTAHTSSDRTRVGTAPHRSARLPTMAPTMPLTVTATANRVPS